MKVKTVAGGVQITARSGVCELRHGRVTLDATELGVVGIVGEDRPCEPSLNEIVQKDCSNASRSNLEQAPWTMKRSRKKAFLTRPPFTLTLVNSPQGGKTYDESRGIRHEAGSEKFRPLARSNTEGLGGHARFAWNGAPF